MIVVTTPTGNIGRHVVQDLLDAGEPVRVIVRDADKLAQTVRDRVEIIEGSHGAAEVVDRAFEGAEAVFWVAPPNPSETLDDTYINFARPAADAVRRLSVPRVVVVTALGGARRGRTGPGWSPPRSGWSISWAKPGRR